MHVNSRDQSIANRSARPRTARRCRKPPIRFKVGRSQAKSDGVVGCQETTQCSRQLVKRLYLFRGRSNYCKYRYGCFVTNMDLSKKVACGSYQGRADSENCITELNVCCYFDSFVTHNIWVPGACGNLIILDCFSLFRHALVNSPQRLTYFTPTQ